MTETFATLAAGLLGCVLLIWLTTSRWRRLQGLHKLFLLPLGHSLAFLVVPGTLLFYGLPEFAGRYGHSALLGLMAFSLVFVFAPLVLKPMQWIGYQRRFPSLVDFLAFRYRGQCVGQLFACLLALALLPLGMAQINSFSAAFSFLLPVENGPAAQLLAPVLFCSALLLMTWAADVARYRTLIVLSALITLLAINITGVIAISGSFGSHAGMDEWIQRTGQDVIIRRYEFSYGLIATFLCASLVMPQFFYLQSESQFAARQFSVSSWFFPLLLLVCSYPMFPILWSGLNLRLETQLHQYLLALPLALEHPWLASLNFMAGTALALAATALILLAIAGPLANYCRPPATPSFAGQTLYDWAKRRRRLFASGWLALCLAATFAARPMSVSDLTLLSLTGLTQFAPALLALFYFPTLTRSGIVAGLLAGMALWFVGLVLPMFIGDWYWHLPTSGYVIHFGVSRWQSWLVEAGMANLMLCIVVSRFTRPSRGEREAAIQCAIDDPPSPQRVTLTQHTLEQMRDRLGRFIGPAAAAREIERATTGLGFFMAERRPYALRLIRDQLARQLQQYLGVASTEHLLDRAIPLSNRPATGADDIRLMESQLSRRPPQLHGIAVELDKLRLFHRKTLENLPLGICSLASDGEILLWNSAMAQLTGIPAEQSSGSTLEALPHGWGETLTEVVNHADPHQPARKICIEGRERWFTFHCTAADSGTIRTVGSQILLVEEVTESVQMARTLIHNERLASVGRLAAGVAHEIGNPVTAIDCLAQDLAYESDPADIQATAENIQKQALRITRIVRSLMSFSRKEDGEHFQRMPLAAPVDEAIHMLGFQHDSKDIRFINRVAPHLEVIADDHQLTQIFINLLGNARDASPAGGEVTVTALASPDGLTVHVDDEGVGIPPDQLGTVFEPFFTTKEAGAGTGLGLSLVYTLVKNHGGSIQAISPVPGQTHGTRMSITLPATGSWPGDVHTAEEL